MRRSFELLLVAFLPLTAIGCLGVQDDTDASLAARFYFEYNDDDATWDGPSQIEVWLYDVSSGTRDELDHYKSRDFVAGDSLHYTRLGAGLYELSVEALDTETGATWASDCTGLLLDRFDEIYSCDIYLDDGSAGGDAGVPSNAATAMDAGMP